MNGMLLLHQLASPRGDGLDPRLARLLEERAMREAQGVIDLPSRDGTVSSGPVPGSRRTEFPQGAAFLPGNVVPMSEYRKPAAGAAKASHTKR